MLKLLIKEIAEEKGISRMKLAQRSGVSYNIVKGIFNDPYRVITTETLHRLAKALGVPTAVLLVDEPDPPPDVSA